MPSVLIVDDLLSIHEMLEAVIHPTGFITAFATDGEKALARYKAEKRYIGKSGAVIWAEIVVTALLDKSGVSRYAFSMARNITDRRALQGMLPVCTTCKKVRDPQGYWSELETYLRDRASAKVEEALCPDCARSGAV